MIKKEIGYSYNDLTIIPKRISDIKSRSECNPFLKEGNLPIFTAPMSSVVNLENIQTFKDNRIIPILPRNIDIKDRIANLNTNWVALSLNEFEEVFINNWDKYLKLGQTYKVCVDIANGHMYSLYQKCQKAKNIAEKNKYTLIIMTGNIANPETYRLITEFITNSGNTVVDYIRVSVGSGSQCFVKGTKINTETGYKSIEEVKIGEKVLTKNGTYCNVIDTLEKYTDKILTINNEISSTLDHKYLVINKKDRNFVTENNLDKYSFWVEAKDLDKEEHLLIKKF